MPGPFEKPATPPADVLVHRLEKGHRANQIMGLGVGEDLQYRRLGVLTQAENELRDGQLTPERALMHIACCNALRKYHEDLAADITSAQRAADKLHAEPADEPTDGES